MLSKIKQAILKPSIIAAIISGIIIFNLPDLFQKYTISVVPIMQHDAKDYCSSEIYDLDGDGYSEIVDSYEYVGKHSLQVLTHDGGIVDQWNLMGNMPKSQNRFTVGDYDKDGMSEIYTFSDLNDTLYLYCIEPLDTIAPIWINNKPLIHLTNKYNKPDYLFTHMEVGDMNVDGYPDLFFVINSGKARFPRNLYIYDIYNDTLIKSKDYGITLNGSATVKDINSDGLLEIYGNMHSPGQVHDSLGFQYSDYDSWLTVYNNSLNLLFDPIKYNGFRTNIFVEHVVIQIPEVDDKPKDYLVVYSNHNGMLKNIPKLQLIDLNGKVVKEHIFPSSSKIERWLTVKSSNNNYSYNIIDKNGSIVSFDQYLVKQDSCNLDMTIRTKCEQIDIDKDGIKENILLGQDNTLIITRDDFSYPTISLIDFAPQHYKMYNATGEETLLFISSDGASAMVEYSNNPLYFLKYGIYLAIFLSIYLFIIIIRKLQLIQLRKKEKTRDQIIELQLKSFKNQLDPHFTFNLFNTIAYKIQMESPESYEAFVEFSNFIRKTLLSSDSITRTIEEEVSKLESYLKLEKLRFGNKINYQISIDDNVDQEFQIPKMILQTFVENAIKHGLHHKVDNGTVSIIITKANKNLYIEIVDDGIGREKAKKLSTDSTGFGLKIMENYFNLFNEYNVGKIRYNIIDLIDEDNNPTGTKVSITIPLNFKYRITKRK